MSRRSKSLRTSSLLFLAGLLGTSTAGEERNPSGTLTGLPRLVILSAEADQSSGTILVIGENLLNTASETEVIVQLGGVALTVRAVTDTEVWADLPAGVTPGTYLLTLSRGEGVVKNDSFNLTIGAVGQSGPAGPPGAMGPMGPAGPKGDKGDPADLSNYYTKAEVDALLAAQLPPAIVVGSDLHLYRKLERDVCTVTVPAQFPTIQTAIDAVVPGGTVCVDAGIYNESVHVNKSVRLSGNGFEETSTITPDDLFYGVYVDADNVIVEGFVINGIGSTWQSSALLLGESHSNITVRSNRMVATSLADVVIAYGYSNNHLFENNVLVGDSSPQIVYIDGVPCCGKPSSGMTFINNTFVGTVGHTSRDDSGVVLLTQATSNVIRRNIFAATGARNLIACSYSSNRINENNFNSEAAGPVKVLAGFDGTTDAAGNWWGDLDPSDNVGGGVVDYSPFADRPFRQNESR